MTQFLLAKSVDPSRVPEWATLAPASDDGFAGKCSATVFGALPTDDIVTVLLDGETFDSFFVSTQREISAGTDYEKTRLYDLLILLAKSSEGVAVWYGSDCQDLGLAEDPAHFARLVGAGLSTPSAEAYAKYSRPKPSASS